MIPSQIKFAGYRSIALEMERPIGQTPTPDLFRAVVAIGTFKHQYRNAVGLLAALPVLRLCNDRIEALLREEEARQFERRGRAA